MAQTESKPEAPMQPVQGGVAQPGKQGMSTGTKVSRRIFASPLSLPCNAWTYCDL